MKHLIVAAAATLALAGTATAETIDFDDLSNGDLVTTIGNATFTSDAGGVQVYDFGQFDESPPNTIGGAGSDFFATLNVDFASAVSNLTFYSGGDNTAGLQASINIFVGGAFHQTVSLVGDGALNTVDLQDLSAFTNVTRIEIFDVVDAFGLVYDTFDFEIDDVNVVPLPAGGLLLLGGLGALGAVRSRRKTK